MNMFRIFGLAGWISFAIVLSGVGLGFYWAVFAR